MNKHPVLILGGSSDIGLAIARRFAEAGYPIQLASRRPDDLESDASDLQIRYEVKVSTHAFDVLDTSGHEAFLDGLPVLPEIAVCVVGLLGDPEKGEKDMAHAITVMRSNYEGPAAILGALANRLEAQGTCTLIGVRV